MEKVYVENDWYDGPRKGVADFNGVPHRFSSNFTDAKGYLDTFTVFPIPEDEFRLEVEQWNIFVEWNKRYEADDTTSDTHPGHGEINKRWDEIELLLKEKRNLIPQDAKIVTATFDQIEQTSRYEFSGPSYGVIWKIIKEDEIQKAQPEP